MNTYWFFDSALKRDTCGAKNIPGKLIKDSCNPLFVEGINEPLEKPWEQQIGNGYPNVFYDPLVHKFRCYYTILLFWLRIQISQRLYKHTMQKNAALRLYYMPNQRMVSNGLNQALVSLNIKAARKTTSLRLARMVQVYC